MTSKQRIFVYGKSLLLDSLASTLSADPRLDLIFLAPPFPSADEFRRLAPDVILYDVAAERPETALALLQTCPSLEVVGVNSESSQVFVWSGRRMAALSAQELVQAFQTPKQARPSE